MPLNLKDLIVVLALSLPLFAVAKSTALIFMNEVDFKRRRNVWLFVTVAAFLCPSFWLFVAIAAPVMYVQGTKDTNPIAFYLLLLNVIPPIPIPIPAIVVNDLFSLDIFRLLSFCVLVPAALRIRKSKELEHMRGMKLTDIALLGFGALQVLLFVPPDLPNHVILQNSFTNDLRNAFLFLVDVYALYYVASRSCRDRKHLLDALAAFCLSCLLMSAIAIFESAKHWLIYTDINWRWGGNIMLTDYYVRGTLLRAQASSGQPLTLAFLLVIGLGFWLYLQSHVRSVHVKIAATTLLCAGLVVTFSRGPWIAAILIYFAYAALSPRGPSRVFKAAIVFLLLGGVLLATPFGKRITSMVPFMGGDVGKGSLTYREQLLDRSLELIKARPILGDQLAYSKMEDLRQGQGIIDVVNTYIEVTLFYGLTGLTFFLTFILSALRKAYRTGRLIAKTDPDGALLGANLAAAILAILLLFADGSLGSGSERIFFVVIGLATAYAALTSPHRSVATGDHPLAA
jgi:O-antigen ligase